MVANESALAPNQCDFALVTINDSEDEAVRKVFEEQEPCKNQFAGERGVFSWWQMQGKASSSDSFVVVHASTADAKGPLPAIELIRELDYRFRPRFLLILGTAGGIRERGIEYGRVVYSRQVHTGYQQVLDYIHEQGTRVDIRLHDDPIQPPSDRLYLHAKRAALDWSMSKDLLALLEEATERIRQLGLVYPDPPAAPDSTANSVPWFQPICEHLQRMKGADRALPPEATEIFSGPYLIDGDQSELFKSILRTFPKVGAIEMEAGAVAQAVLHSTESERFVGYLVIKGISDVVDSGVPSDARKPVRKAMARLASQASAAFAKSMIESWRGTTGQGYGRLSLIPPRYSAILTSELGDMRWTNSVVYEAVRLDSYSRMLERFCLQESAFKSAWSFCYLAPYRFFAALHPSIDEAAPEYSLDTATEVLALHSNDVEKLKEALRKKFPHFSVFADLAQRKQEVVRVMHKGGKWESENRAFLPAFAWANKDLTCHVLGDSDLAGEEWVRSDRVVLNDELLFDYDQDTKRLVITYLDPIGTGKSFLRFKEHCKAKSSPENSFDYLMGQACQPGNKEEVTVPRPARP